MKEGSLVEAKVGKEKIKGKVMPSLDKDILVLKLDSGYNMGIKKAKIKSFKTLKGKGNVKKIVKKVKSKKSLKTIAILHTGGTVASRVDYETGGVSSQFTPEDLLRMYPELGERVNIRSKLILNVFSEDLGFKHYNLIAKEIEKEVKKKVDGVIVTHGTDTMHYSSAALSFILEGLKVPVVFVGSQRSSDRGSSDARLNLVSACDFIVKSGLAGVFVCMHEGMGDDSCLIFNGLKVRKLHSSRRDAFKAVNCKPVARVSGGKFKILDGFKVKGEKFKLRLFKESLKVGFLKVHPQMCKEEVLCFKKFDGLVVEGTGLGHVGVNDNLEVLKAFKSLKIPIVMSSQCVFGRVNMNVYSTGRKLQEFIFGNLNDMTPETSFIKLAWLLSNYPKKVKDMFMVDFRGEFNERMGEEFLD